ncbi:MAG: 50S ribosomal protein L22 [bacterium]|nr:50S ribosomal protein L22 [bacterium]
MKATLTNARISPRKANLVAGLVRGLKVNDALNQLRFTNKKAAGIIYKVITSAAANAVNNMAQDQEKLTIKSILVTKGSVLKRGLPVSRGRWHPLKKRNSNIVVEIGIEDPTKAPSAPTKEQAEKKPEEAKSATPKKSPAKKPTAKKSPAKPKKKSSTV